MGGSRKNNRPARKINHGSTDGSDEKTDAVLWSHLHGEGHRAEVIYIPTADPVRVQVDHLVQHTNIRWSKCQAKLEMVFKFHVCAKVKGKNSLTLFSWLVMFWVISGLQFVFEKSSLINTNMTRQHTPNLTLGVHSRLLTLLCLSHS